MSPVKRILALPLVLLALLVQGFTPAAAAVMTARMADPFAAMPICSVSFDGTQRDDSGDQHRQLCEACSVCSAPAAIVTPDTPVLAPPAVVRVAEKPAVESVGPRGPPALTPKARGPPTLS